MATSEEDAANGPILEAITKRLNYYYDQIEAIRAVDNKKYRNEPLTKDEICLSNRKSIFKAHVDEYHLLKKMFSKKAAVEEEKETKTRSESIHDLDAEVEIESIRNDEGWVQEFVGKFHGRRILARCYKNKDEEESLEISRSIIAPHVLLYYGKTKHARPYHIF